MDKGDQGNCADVVFQVPRGLKTVIEVSKGQQGNVLLRHFKNRGWTFAETDPDFVIGERACVVFVSLKYHLLQPEYVKTRISELQCFDICIVLCLIDAEDVFATLHSINLSLTIILKRHTITPFHTEHFTIHVIEKYQRHICAATSFHAEFFTTVSEDQVLLEWILKPPPYEIFFHTQLYITHIGLKKNHTRVQTLGLECTTPKIPNQHNTTPKIPNQPQPAFQRENY